jgi:hypothetical protein
VARPPSPALSLLYVPLLCAVGCGDVSPSGPEIRFDACQDLVVVPDPAVTDGQRAGIRSGIALWNDRARTRLTLEAPTATPELAIRFQRAAAPFHGYYDAQRATVFINEDLRDAAQAIVIAHEIGHAFALAHVNQRPSVMTSGNLDTEPTAEDVDELAALWGACAPAGASE